MDWTNYPEDEADIQNQIESLCHTMDLLFPDRNILTDARKARPVQEEEAKQQDLPSTPSQQAQEPNEFDKHQIASDAEAQELYDDVRKQFEEFFQIQLPHGIKVQFTGEAPEKEENSTVASVYVSNREKASGQAISKGNERMLWIDHSLSRLDCINVLVQELAYVWQLENWSLNQVYSRCKTISENQSAQLYQAAAEGMRIWALMAYIKGISEEDYFEKMENNLQAGNDPWKIGYRMYIDDFPLQMEDGKYTSTPFTADIPLDLNEVIKRL